MSPKELRERLIETWTDHGVDYLTACDGADAVLRVVRDAMREPTTEQFLRAKCPLSAGDLRGYEEWSAECRAWLEASPLGEPKP